MSLFCSHTPQFSCHNARMKIVQYNCDNWIWIFLQFWIIKKWWKIQMFRTPLGFSQKVWNSSFRIFILLPAIFYPFPHFCRFSSDKMFGHMPSWKAGTIKTVPVCQVFYSLALLETDFSHFCSGRSTEHWAAAAKAWFFNLSEGYAPVKSRSADFLLEFRALWGHKSGSYSGNEGWE